MRATITASGGADPAVAWARYENLEPLVDVVAADPGGHRRDAPHSRPASTAWSSGRSGCGCRSRCWPSTPEAMEWSWHVRLGPVHARLDHVVRHAPGGCTTEVVIDAPAFAVVGYRPLAALALRRLVRRDLLY